MFNADKFPFLRMLQNSVYKFNILPGLYPAASYDVRVGIEEGRGKEGRGS
jgi:hypothetical protein